LTSVKQAVIQNCHFYNWRCCRNDDVITCMLYSSSVGRCI